MKIGRIAYFGDEKSHTYAAARRMIEEGEFVGFKTIDEAAAAAAAGEFDACVVPAENSAEGSVDATLDCLINLPLFVRGETTRRIHQNLVVLEGAGSQDVEVVYSHPQALAQCREWLHKNLPDAKLMSVYSTGYALKLIDCKSKAAIALTAGEGQKILFDSIEDFPDNTTRFLILGKSPLSEGAKASAIFGARNVPGGLLKVLEVFYRCGVNLTRIESRPSRAGLGDYIFFADFTLPDDTDLRRLLDALNENTEYFKFLGRYDDINKVEAKNF